MILHNVRVTQFSVMANTDYTEISLRVPQSETHITEFRSAEVIEKLSTACHFAVPVALDIFSVRYDGATTAKVDA